VIDSGPPVPIDQLERIFDRMWRGDTARTAVGMHCGIGLSLARSLAGCLAMSLPPTCAPTARCGFAWRTLCRLGSPSARFADPRADHARKFILPSRSSDTLQV